MFFTTINNPKFEVCYATERPYTDLKMRYHNPKESIFLPTVLTDLKQIVTTCVESSGNTSSINSPQAQINNHIKLKQMCFADDIIDQESKWDSYIDKLLNTLNEAVNDPVRKVSEKLKLAQNQLTSSTSEELIKKVTFSELDAYHDESTLFWRYSHYGYSNDIIYEKENASSEVTSYKIGHDFGDSLFSGYMKDGMFNSDLRVAIDNYGACVFNYFDLHRQGLVVKEQGYMNTSFHKVENTNIADLSVSYQDYLNNLSQHQLYTVKYSNDNINLLQQEGLIFIPKNTVSSSACFQSGEKFHPKICLIGDHGNIDVILQDSD